MSDKRKPHRRYGAARQLGAINSILQAQPRTRAHRDGDPTRRLEDREIHRKGIKPRSHPHNADLLQRASSAEMPQNLQRPSNDGHNALPEQSREQSRLQQQLSQPKPVPLPHISVDQRPSRSTQNEKRGVLRSSTSMVRSPKDKDPRSETTFMASDRSFEEYRSSSEKRMRANDEDDKEHEQPNKKHQAIHSDLRLRRQAHYQDPTVKAKTEAKVLTAMAAPEAESHSCSTPKRSAQLPDPHSSNFTPGHQIRVTGLQKPLQTLATSTTSGRNKKKRKTKTEYAEEPAPKRLCHSNSVESTDTKPILSAQSHKEQAMKPDPSSTEVKPDAMQKAMESTRLQLSRPMSRRSSQPVRPDSSFAPVAPNYECDLKFYEYANDSVPVLHSSMIQHAHDTELNNSPPDMLVLDALIAIEASSKSQSKKGWPLAFNLADRSPNKRSPVRVVDDVDLYLHKTEAENQLCVATEHGLLCLTEYLKLIGVPNTQPVRFEGRIPSWARIALRALEKRRVTQTWGEVRIVRKGMSPEGHRVALQQETYVYGEAQKNRINQKTPKATLSGGAEFAKSEIETMAEKYAVAQALTEPEVGELEILETASGDLPLPAGSVVTVYNIDEDDVWAYGRLSGTNKRGRFPIAFTCPVDWSLDRFAGTDKSLCTPLVESTDPTETDWNGLTDWIRKNGFPEGPTWEATLAESAARAKVQKARTIAARDFQVNANARKQADNKARVAEQLRARNAPCFKSPIETSASPKSAKIAATDSASEFVPEELNVELSDISSTKDIKDHEVPEIRVSASATTSHAVGAESRDEVKPNEPMTIIEGSGIEVEVEKSSTGPDDVKRKIVVSNAFNKSGPAESHQNDSSPTAHKGVAGAHDPSSIPRYNPFSRNDDIEYDWGDSDEEL